MGSQEVLVWHEGIEKQGAHTQGDAMPKVGKKHYAYTKTGKAAAKKAAKKMGKKVTNTKTKY